MKITGFKLLKGGIGGIEVDGIELAGTASSKVMFRDKVKRTRQFPLSTVLRSTVEILNYPFLVGTEHWRNEFAPFMKADFSAPDRSGDNVLTDQGKRLVGLWEAARISKCTIENGAYKITGELLFDMCVVKATVLVAPNDDHSLYSFVEETLATIVELIDQTITTPQAGIGTGVEMRELVQKISSAEEDIIPDGMSDEEAYIHMMRTASKKGFGVIMDDNMLSMIATGLPEHEEGDFVMGGETEEPDQFDETPEDLGVVKSPTTKDKSIFSETLPNITEEIE